MIIGYVAPLEHDERACFRQASITGHFAQTDLAAA
jgi:hypothetical protein